MNLLKSPALIAICIKISTYDKTGALLDFSQMWNYQYKRQFQECLINFDIIWNLSSKIQASRKICGIFEWTPFFLHFVFFFFYLLLQKHSSKVNQRAFPQNRIFSRKRLFLGSRSCRWGDQSHLAEERIRQGSEGGLRRWRRSSGGNIRPLFVCALPFLLQFQSTLTQSKRSF